MEPNILDLRQERCPMALLLAKRYLISLHEQSSASLLTSDPQSLKDIQRFVTAKGWQHDCQPQEGHFALHVTLCLDVTRENS